MSTDLTLTIFLLAYGAIAIGHVPFFRVDRTGAALLGSIALIVTEQIGMDAAWKAVSFETMSLLFGLMVVSAAFVVGGFYEWAAARIARAPLSPPMLLAVLILAAAGMSALLTNDVVALAMTPLLVGITLSRGLNPIPFALGLCFAANNGAAATLLGSPQNMIIANQLGLSFPTFMKFVGLPAVLSLPIVWGVLALLYRGKWMLPEGPDAQVAPTISIPFDKVETIKAAIVTLLVVGAFTLTAWPHALVALAAAGFLLLNRRISSADMLQYVDGNLLLLLFGLFVLNAAIAQTPAPAALLNDLAHAGLNLREPIPLMLAMAVLSNIVGNSPAVMLAIPYLGQGNPGITGAALALGTGFSSNLVIFGSLAGIIVVEAAAKKGLKISFTEFSRAGAVVSLLSMILGLGWVILLSR